MIQFLTEYTTDEIKILCGGEEPLRAIKFVMSIIDIICFVIPILLIVLITISFVKNVISQTADDMKKEFSMVIKKIISCVAIFFVPTIINVAMSVLGNLGIDYVACINASKESDLSKYKIEVKKTTNNDNFIFEDENRPTVVDGNDDGNNNTTDNTENTNTLNVTTDYNIFIGDSRTVGMKLSVTESKKDKWICKESVGYKWFMDTASKELKEYLKENKNKQYNIFINLGVNDIDNIESYKSTFSSLGETLKKHNVIIVSVNPINEELWKSQYISNNKIEEFNKKISTTSNVVYCDTYSKIKDNFSTTDGLHYKASTYKKIYKEMKNCL